jgi:hypothetical protein
MPRTACGHVEGEAQLSARKGVGGRLRGLKPGGPDGGNQDWKIPHQEIPCRTWQGQCLERPRCDCSCDCLLCREV